jgi:hypothetical protein
LGQLYCNASEKLARMTEVLFASREEETRSQASSIAVFVCYGASNSRLPSASPATQPEDVCLVVLTISPCSYLLQDLNSRIVKAERIALFSRGVDRGLGSGWQ